MQLDTDRFLDLVERTSELVFFDLEAVGLNGDYGTIVCASFKPYGLKPITYTVKQLGNDSKLVKECKEILQEYTAWCSFYGKNFDIKMLNTRLLKHGQRPVDKRPHIDLYWIIRNSTNTSRRSQAHLLNWLGTPEQKMSVSADVWATLGENTQEKIETLVERCESDVIGLENLYERTKNFILDVKR